MCLYLFLLFTLVPAVELWLLINIGNQIGIGATVLLIVVTGILGAALTRQQGLKVLSQFQQQTAQGKMPTESLREGMMIIVAGAVLITPGLLTDLFGFSLLIPPYRRWLGRKLAAWLKQRTIVQVQSFQTYQQTTQQQPPKQRSVDPSVIDAEFTREIVDDETADE